MPRLQGRYRDEIVPKLSQEFGIDNPMAVPRIQKIVLNIGLGEATQNIKLLDDAVEELAQIAGQRPTITRKALLEYCKLDTLAMVRILEKLKELI